MSAACPRLFEVEALRDGRLTGAERASFERHAASCPACSREAKALDALSGALRAGNDDDQVRDRRERVRLLAAFDRALMAPEPRRSHRALAWAAVAALVVVVAVSRHRTDTRRTVASNVANAVVHADGASIWSQSREGSRDKVVLERGSLWIHVDHSVSQAGLLVALPDGELEDIGTTFTVAAAAGHTTRVAVEDGRVVLRLHGFPPRTIGAGESWALSAPAALAASSAAPSAVVAPPSASATSGAPSVDASGAGARVAVPAPSAEHRDTSSDFRAAMDALGRGDNAEAARLFETFLEKHPHDPRAEDAAYSRVIALQRAGNSRLMKAAAAAYLERYPAAFRRTEIERLSR
jgi:hypothetical protein